MNTSSPIIWKQKRFISADRAISATGMNGVVRHAVIAKIIGCDGANFRRLLMRKSFRSDARFVEFVMDGDALYELKNLCISRQAGKFWSAFVLVRGCEFREVSYEETRLLAQMLNDNLVSEMKKHLSISLSERSQTCLIAA